MKYPYMIRRIKKRAITWFFGVEYETLYFKTIRELLREYKESDIVYQLKGSKYEFYDVAKTLNYKDGLIESNKYYNEYVNKLLKDNDIDYRICETWGDTWESEVK